MKNVIFLLAVIFLMGCTPEAKEINYGVDMCHFCKMTVVDNQHAAQLVTTKGKAYMFDAIECMVNYTATDGEDEYAFLLVNDYNNPGKLIPAKKSHFLRSRAIPSPMGAYLSAFESEEIVQNTMETKGGNIHTWDALGDVLKQKLPE